MVSEPRSLTRIYDSIAPFLERVVTIASPVSALLTTFIYVFQHKLNLAFFPINGLFQTFNPLHRICNGEAMGEDFNPYLGLGTTTVTAFLTSLFGCSLSASLAANSLLLIFFHWLTYCVLFKLVGLSLKHSIIFSSSIITLLLIALFEPFALPLLNDVNQSLNYSLIYRWQELMLPGNSNLGLRSALPAISCCISLLGFHFLKKRPGAKFCFLGALIGVQPLWSNDYGVPSAIALFAITLVHLFKSNTVRKLPQIGGVLMSATLTFLLLGSVLTHGHLFQWLRESRGVASDQFWYFEVRQFNSANLKGLLAGKILDLKDIIDYFVHPFFFIYLSALTIVGLSALWSKENFNHLLLMYVGITVFGAGTLSSLGGTFFWRYYTPTNFVSYFVVFVAISILIRQANLSSRLRRLTSSVQRYRYLAPTVIRVIHALFVGYFLTLSIAAILLVTFVHPLSSQPYENHSFFYTKELDGWLNKRFEPAYHIAERIRQQTQTLPPTQRMLSTYASMMDVVVGSKNATGIDYIIHALGDRSRTRYLDRWKAAMPEYITTIREDFTDWEAWVRRTNWWFYRNFATVYKPIEASHYNIVWQRSKTAKTIETPTAECTVRRNSDHSADLIVNTQRSLARTKKDDVYLIDLALKYHLNVKNAWVPIFGRGLINAIEIQTPSLKSLGHLNNRAYGLPPRHQDWHVPIEHRLGTPSVLRLVGYPETQTTLVIERCQAQVFLPLSTFTVTKKLQPADISNQSWKNGISIASTNQAGFMTNDSQISTVYVGDSVTFTHSENRKIIAIQGNQVWVSGSALDPIKDGYPNSIVITQK
jgi:hypothetical protein